MSTFILRLAESGPGLAVAVKDLIDMVGLPTTAGSRAVATDARPAAADAACLAGIRAGEAAGTLHLVGKTNLHELGYGVTGVNPWYGTPGQPMGPGPGAGRVVERLGGGGGHGRGRRRPRHRHRRLRSASRPPAAASPG